MPQPLPILLALALLMGGSSRATAQAEREGIEIRAVPDADPAFIAELVGQLGSADWLMRDLATLKLADLEPGVTLEALEAQITRDDLTPEQRTRLWLACLRRFNDRPKGALGVQFGSIAMGAVEVVPIDPDPLFPASMILRQGDLIATVDDRVLTGINDFRAEILSRDPGDLLPVTLIRDERVYRFSLELGAYANLSGGARMDTPMLIRTLGMRWDQLGITIASPGRVGDAVGLDDWARAAFPEGIVPDPREPELVASRGIVLGPGMNDSPDASRWGRTIVDVWTDPADFAHDSDQRGSLLLGEQLQPMIVLQNLLERERTQLQDDLRRAGDEETCAFVQSQLDDLAPKIERVRDRIDAMREPAP